MTGAMTAAAVGIDPALQSALAPIRSAVIPSAITPALASLAARYLNGLDSPRNTPVTDAPVRSVRLSASDGIGPDAKPTTR